MMQTLQFVCCINIRTSSNPMDPLTVLLYWRCMLYHLLILHTYGCVWQPVLNKYDDDDDNAIQSTAMTTALVIVSTCPNVIRWDDLWHLCHCLSPSLRHHHQTPQIQTLYQTRCCRTTLQSPPRSVSASPTVTTSTHNTHHSHSMYTTHTARTSVCEERTSHEDQRKNYRKDTVEEKWRGQHCLWLAALWLCSAIKKG